MDASEYSSTGTYSSRLCTLYICFELFRSCVRIVTSNRAGMGKSLYIKRLREALETQTSVQPLEVVVPLHGPVVTADTVVKALEKHFGKHTATIFHIDIAPSVSEVAYM